MTWPSCCCYRLDPIPKHDIQYLEPPLESIIVTRIQSFSMTPILCEHIINTVNMDHVQYDLIHHVNLPQPNRIIALTRP